MGVASGPTLSIAFSRRTGFRHLLCLRVGYMGSEIKEAIGYFNGLCDTLWCLRINGCIGVAERETFCQIF